MDARIKELPGLERDVVQLYIDLYKTPKPLTDEQVRECVRKAHEDLMNLPWSFPPAWIWDNEDGD